MKLIVSLSATAEHIKLTRTELKDLATDPVGSARNLKLSDLVAILKMASDLYYNKGKSPISDRAFDVLKEELMFRRPDHPFLRQVGAPVRNTSRKVKLPYQLFSLDKVKPHNVEQWLDRHRGPWVVSDKEDGNSLEITYLDGRLRGIYRRGDRLTGEDVTHLAPHLDIPMTVNVGGKFAVRAEIAMPVGSFDKHFASRFANPRNLVAGALTKRQVHEAIPHLHTLAYEMIEPRMKPSASLAKLQKMGFKVVPHKVYTKLTAAQLEALLKQRHARSKYEIDGLVLEQDQVTKRPTSGAFPDYAVAFKVDDEDNAALVQVKSVVWEESKHGALKPRINIPPTKLSGVTVKFATGHNAFFIEHGYRKKDEGKGLPVRPIGPGATIQIIRSGEVIPHVMKVVKGVARPQMPKQSYKYGRTGVDIYLTEKTDLVRAKRLESFFKTVGVEFMRLGTIQKLMEQGFDTLGKILNATPDDYMKVPGFKETMAQKLYRAVQSKTRQVELSALMDASGVFGAGLGQRRMKVLIDKYPGVLSWGDKTRGQIIRTVQTVDGFDTLAAQFADGLPKFIKWLARTRIKPILPTKVRKVSTKLVGQQVVFTGFRDTDLSSQIVSNGGAVGSDVSNKTTILLVKDKASGSAKLKKAASQGIKIMTADEFRRRFRL